MQRERNIFRLLKTDGDWAAIKQIVRFISGWRCFFMFLSSGIDSDSCGDSRYPVSDGQQVPSFLAGGRICGAGCDDHGVLCHLSGKTVDSCGYDTEYLV